MSAYFMMLDICTLPAIYSTPPRSPYLDAKRRRRIVNFGASIRPSLEKIIDDEFGGIYVPSTARSSRLKGSNLPTEVACF